MEVTEALDREVVVERAEEVRLWLLGLQLHGRATNGIQRELGAIIDNDPGAYINGQRPLAGLTVADFIAELHRPNGGAVGRVKSVGLTALNELREKIPAGSARALPQAVAEPEYTAPEPEYTAPVLDEAEAPPAAPAPQPARRRGRPKGSTRAARAEGMRQASPAGQQPPPAEEPRRRRGRPRREAAPPPAATTAATTGGDTPSDSAAAPYELAPIACDDTMLSQIVRLWPSLHPHARRAVVTYASELWAEASYDAKG